MSAASTGRRSRVNDDVLNESVQELYEHAPCGYIFTTPDGRLTRVNQTFVAWTGYSRDELLAAMRLQDLLTVPGKIFYENQYAPLLRMQGFVKEVAFDLVRRGRDPLPVLVSSVQRSGPDGQPLLVASIIFDAPDRRAYERELLLRRRQAEQLAAVITASNDAIVTASPDGDVLTWNGGAERLFGFAARHIVGRSLSMILPDFDRQAEFQRVWGELRAGRGGHLEAPARHADGHPIDVSVGLTPHLGALGELSAVSLIMRDISERRALERLQQEFLAMASHELKSPVATIRGHAQLMRRRGSYSERAVETIVAQADQLGRLIDDLLLASQIQADRLDLRPTSVDLVAEARAAVEQGQAQGHDMRLEAPPRPLLVWADRQRLGQVFANLVTNAVKYSPQGSHVVVRVRQQDAEARVDVIDQGIGIPPDALPHIFDRFFRNEASARQAQGLGLGLFITRRIVEAHRGSITVTSELGRGSTFTVALPLSSGPDQLPSLANSGH